MTTLKTILGLSTVVLVVSAGRPWYHSAIRSAPVQDANRVVSSIGTEAANNGWDINSIIDSLATSPQGISKMHGMLTQIQSIGDQVQDEVKKYLDYRSESAVPTYATIPNRPVPMTYRPTPVFDQTFIPRPTPVVNNVLGETAVIRGSLQDVGGPFVHAEIVPDLMPVAPKHQLQIRFANDALVDMGNELTPSATAFPPASFMWPSYEKELYTLMLIDCGPQNTTSTYIHWLVTNIGSNHELSHGDLHVEYMQSSPPMATPNRRYVYLVYKQNAPIPRETSGVEYVRFDQMRPRNKFNLAAFVAQNNLGLPLAGNFYTSSCDSSVRAAWLKITDVMMGEPGC